MAEKQMKVSKLLEGYKDWVNTGDIQFLQEPKQQTDVSRCIEELKLIMETLERKNKRQQKEGYNWYEAHKKGKELWEMLAKYALRNIEPTAKGNSTLYSFLKSATEFEDVLYGLESYYRDHTLHSLWVYLIGEDILRRPIKKRASGKDICLRENLNWYLFNDISKDAEKYSYPKILVKYSETKEKSLTKAVSRYTDSTWCLIALCHDLGYSLEKLGALNDKVTAVLKYFTISDMEQTGYSLDIEHQYLISQCLELMAMDVRIVPDEDLSKVEKADKDPSNRNKIRETLDKVGETLDLDTDLIKVAEGLVVPADSEVLEDIKELDKRTLIKCYRDDSTYWRLCRSLEKKQHGILSSYLIFKILGIFADATVRGPAEVWGLDDDEVVENIIRGDILFAIAQHEFDFAHIFEFGSLADILILADELEEFSRFGRPLLSREYQPTTANANIVLIPKDKDITIKIIYDVKEGHNLIHFFIRKAQRLGRIYSLNESDEATGPYRIKQIVMTAKKKVKTNKALGISIKLNINPDDNKCQLLDYKSSRTASSSDTRDYPISLYDDKIYLILGEKEKTLRESFKEAIIFNGLSREWGGERQEYIDLLNPSEEKT